MTELSQIDDFETYRPLHKHDLSKLDRRDALKSMIKVTEKRADEDVHRKIKSRMVADGRNKGPTRGTRSLMGNHQRLEQTAQS